MKAKLKEVPAIIPFRPKEEDRPMILRLVHKRKPKNMSVLIRDGLKKLDQEDRKESAK
jgi:hypothetical protein